MSQVHVVAHSGDVRSAPPHLVYRRDAGSCVEQNPDGSYASLRQRSSQASLVFLDVLMSGKITDNTNYKTCARADARDTVREDQEISKMLAPAGQLQRPPTPGLKAPKCTTYFNSSITSMMCLLPHSRAMSTARRPMLSIDVTLAPAVSKTLTAATRASASTAARHPWSSSMSSCPGRLHRIANGVWPSMSVASTSAPCSRRRASTSEPQWRRTAAQSGGSNPLSIKGSRATSWSSPHTSLTASIEFCWSARNNESLDMRPFGASGGDEVRALQRGVVGVL
eukprot:CAMPEP_0194550728 /NCGR_PEP_ID=MMETSP0253-20130528/95857_1 /TAXON_ID=2966 /ORGANISM="Noctiluca scintillans" /LENGTH=280 /DNA_ID=CAMNT_0039398171 /DNA_START=535 /DNA_END=1377 /DNA_ORIENTATION=+